MEPQDQEWGTTEGGSQPLEERWPWGLFFRQNVCLGQDGFIEPRRRRGSSTEELGDAHLRLHLPEVRKQLSENRKDLGARNKEGQMPEV